ncbi:MAG TPA: class I SAM-dependent methyltransferase [Nocardioides sp.]|uniref:class I SAM-dependent methyltransferase n=1 Tax=Nocardioides sp. TaxID=35761 RepID=UPI002E377669|nr:class I SAM-dependent methyltransferase [Nocardioides sp.]HEX5086758.1 class I SAM-dependent methyltransferase [Nocardioides sp.]
MSGQGIVPDTKDWTWVLDERCPDCGFDAGGVDPAEIGPAVRDNARGWLAVLAQPGATERPDEHTWSPLEYACHVRDVNRKFTERLQLMLDHDEPQFANWDQDATAVEDRYELQDPAVVGPEVVEAAEVVAATYDELAGADERTRGRRGVRSDGSVFTVDTLGRYHLHDLVHHAHDVRDFAARATVAAYDVDAEAFSDGVSKLSDEFDAELDWFAGAVGDGGAVLEIGSGGGRDAAALEKRGLTVRRSDISPGFVELMRNRGYDADVLDPLTDDLVDERHGPYDGVWACACLLHVAREDVPTVLTRLAGATRVGGVLGMSLKEGDGEEWSTHGHVRGPRRFVYWREAPLGTALEDAGWRVHEINHRTTSNGQPWLVTRAVRS